MKVKLTAPIEKLYELTTSLANIPYSLLLDKSEPNVFYVRLRVQTDNNSFLEQVIRDCDVKEMQIY